MYLLGLFADDTVITPTEGSEAPIRVTEGLGLHMNERDSLGVELASDYSRGLLGKVTKSPDTTLLLERIADSLEIISNSLDYIKDKL